MQEIAERRRELARTLKPARARLLFLRSPIHFALAFALVALAAAFGRLRGRTAPSSGTFLAILPFAFPWGGGLAAASTTFSTITLSALAAVAFAAGWEALLGVPECPFLGRSVGSLLLDDELPQEGGLEELIGLVLMPVLESPVLGNVRLELARLRYLLQVQGKHRLFADALCACKNKLEVVLEGPHLVVAKPQDFSEVDDVVHGTTGIICPMILIDHEQ